MDLPSYFADFLSDIRPTQEQRDELKAGHEELRGHWNAYQPLKPIIVTDFLQGSYKRGTAVRPSNGKKSDVDIVVVTRLSEDEYNPEGAIALLTPFLDKHYAGRWTPQGRSVGIQLDEIEMDLVLTSAPKEAQVGLLKSEGITSDDALDDDAPEPLRKALNEAARWKGEPLRIPDREAKRWEHTHPIAQLEWTSAKNARCDGHFLGVVKAIKWWKYECRADVDKPRSYPLERIIGECCPDRLDSVAQGVALTLERITSDYATGKPRLDDYGTGRDVLARISAGEFNAFHTAAREAAAIARRALQSETRAESVALWKQLFGSRFPDAPGSGGASPPSGGFTRREGPSEPSRGRFA